MLLGVKGVYDISVLTQIDISEYHVLLACDNASIYNEVLTNILKYMKRYQIIELFPKMKVGKYSYGPLCSQWLGIESIGAFCSFAQGTEVVDNHDVYISTHEFLSFPGDFTKHAGYVPGISVAKPREHKKCKIGNDVWIGKNATIIAGCNIGNGVIVGAGAVVTKDIPDYAVAVGVPAKIIRYRYLPEQIERLNKIAW